MEKKPTKDNQLPTIPEDIIPQILMVRDSGKTNMFDIQTVMRVAYEMDQVQLIEFLAESDENKNAYIDFILYGKREQNK